MIHESVPDNEKPYQKRRRFLVGFFAIGLFLLSVALELSQRELDLLQLLRGIGRVMISAISPDTPFPSIALLPNLLGFAAVLRNMIPPVVMFLLVLWLGARFMQALYGIPKTKQANDYLFTSLFGPVVGRGPSVAKLSATLMLEPITKIKSKPVIIVRGGSIVGDQYRPEILIGGPAMLIVYNDSAVLLERAGSLARVLGPGLHWLRRFEKIRTIVDLRPRSYSLEVKGMSREGIPVEWPIDIHFQINDQDEGPHEATENSPYAYSEGAVFKAATDEWLREPDRTDHLDWRGRVAKGEAEGKLRNIMARYSLDQLIRPDDDEADTTRQSIQRELEHALQESAANHGAKIRRVTLGNVAIADLAAQQWFLTWQARWERQSRIELAEGKATRVSRIENAKAAAKREMMLSIVESFRPLIDAGQPINPDVVLMRFVETMRRLAAPAKTFPITMYSEQALATLHRLEFMFEAAPDGDEHERAQAEE